MTGIFLALLGAVMATNQPATTNATPRNTNATVAVTNSSELVDKEFKKIQEEDDAALTEVDKWIQENQAFVATGGGMPTELLRERIQTRLGVVRKLYEEFVKANPRHVGGHLAFGSFLMDTKDHVAARVEYEKALELDPKNPAAWNNMANLYSHLGPVSKMLEYYSKAIELNPNESAYYANLATAVFVYRTDAQEYFHLHGEQEVFNKSLELYQKAFKLDPSNFTLATEVAQNYYGIVPTRTEEALNAWTNALKIATSDVQREGVYLHMARFKLNAGRFQEAHAQLDAVTNETLMDVKKRLLRNLTEQEKQAQTNAPPAKVEIKEPDKK